MIIYLPVCMLGSREGGSTWTKANLFALRQTGYYIFQIFWVSL